MQITLHNTLTRKKEAFTPIKPGQVGIYSCGPTVYNFAHIGNLRTFVFEDVLRRTLKLNGLEVKQVRNITDVDDKTIRDSQKEGMTLKDFTEKYTVEFFKDLDALNIESAEVYPKATEHVAEMIRLIECLLEKGIAYASDDGVYFSIEKFPDYGKLAHLDIEGLKAGASGRVLKDEYEKENVADFALWKFWDANDGDVKWEAPFGAGRPGWHIECSAMSTKHLGETFDIHTGGIDLLFPHHQDEVAQSEACSGKSLANYWLHAEHLLVDDRKMSKSMKNFYTLRDVVGHGVDSVALRYFYFSAHYRTKLNFTWEALSGAQNALYNLYNIVETWGEPTVSSNTAVKQFKERLNDDLDTAGALAVLWGVVKDETMENGIKGATLLVMDRALGIKLDEHVGRPLQIPEDIQGMLAKRADARANKDWKASDEMRDKIEQLGYFVEDKENEQRLRRKH